MCVAEVGIVVAAGCETPHSMTQAETVEASVPGSVPGSSSALSETLEPSGRVVRESDTDSSWETVQKHTVALTGPRDVTYYREAFLKPLETLIGRVSENILSFGPPRVRVCCRLVRQAM